VASTRLIIQRLSADHDRGGFDCGVEELNLYLLKYSRQHERKGIGRTYVATEEGEKRVLGYYTISSSAVAFEIVPENLPRHPIPVALIGRLAVDQNAQGRGLGEMLLIDALRSAERAGESVGIYAIVVDALEDKPRSLEVRFSRTARRPPSPLLANGSRQRTEPVAAGSMLEVRTQRIEVPAATNTNTQASPTQ
jgi:GNAT superfamily N-acetyltransferase